MNNKTIKALIPFAELVAMGLAFVNALIIMNSLNMVGYAHYSYVSTIVLWAVVFMDMGISTLIFNKGLQNDLKELDTYLTARTLNSIVVILILSLFFLVAKPSLFIAGIIYSLVIFFNSTSKLLKSLARSRELSRNDLQISLTEILLRFVILGSLYLLLPSQHWHLWLVMLSLLAAGCIAFYFNYTLLTRKIHFKIKLVHPEGITAAITQSFHESKYFILLSFLIAVMGRVEIIFLEKYATPDNLSLFAVSRTMLDFTQFFFASIITTQFKWIYNHQKKSYLMFIVGSLLVIAVVLLLSQWIFNLLLPQKYINSYQIFNKLIFSLIPFIFYFYFIAKLNFEKRTLVNFILLLIPLLIKISIYYVLKSADIPDYYTVYTAVEYLTLTIFLIYFISFRPTHKKSEFS